jgi:hypothetical protein
MGLCVFKVEAAWMAALAMVSAALRLNETDGRRIPDMLFLFLLLFQ